MRPGGRLNIKMPPYQYRDTHIKYLIFNMGIPIPGKDGLYIETGPCVLSMAVYGRQPQTIIACS